MQIVKVYGPYKRKQDDRKVVVLRLIDGTLTTKSYARFLYEQENGEIGDINLTVDHIDEDVTNDSLNNLDLLSRALNIAKSKSARIEMYSGICPICNKEVSRRMSRVKRTLNKGLTPFCSKFCSGVRNSRL